MKILVIHQGFPGQFSHLIPTLQNRGDEIWTIGTPRTKGQIPSGVHFLPYRPKQKNGNDTFPLASELETKVIRGEGVGGIAAKLAEGAVTGSQWVPDLIIGHPGWGEMLFLGDVWPEVPQLHYVEFFHGVPGTDNDFSDYYATPQTWKEKARARIKNANLITNLNQMKVGLCPTHFQHSLLPDWAQQKTKVIHDGINTAWLCPDSSVKLRIPANSNLRNEIVLDAGDPVITFVNRTFEPYRGVHIFMESIAQLQARHPTVHTLMIGKDTPKVSYGASRSDERGWLTALREQMGNRLDWKRIHALGQVSHTTLRDIYRISSAHVYLTYPFVLSWSLLEAMSCEALVVCSETKPVKELIRHGENGLMVPFGDSNALANTLLKTLQHPESMRPIRKRARKHIQSNYELNDCLEKQLDLMNSLMAH